MMDENKHSYAGDSMRRVEDEEMITGAGCYTDDLQFPEMTHLHFVRSPYPHAKIKKMDLSAAMESEGVLAIYTADDLIRDGVNPYPIPGPPGDFVTQEILDQGYRNGNGEPMDPPRWLALAKDEVRYVGQPVVAILAESAENALTASELVEVDYEELASVGTIQDAEKESAPAIWKGAPGNLLIQMEHGDAAKTDRIFAEADHVTELELSNSRLVGNAMEPRASVCRRDPEQDRLILHAGHQAPTGLQESLCKDIFGWSTDKLRIVVGHLGGGFGIRAETYPEEIVTVYAAHKQSRPVKWNGDRTQEFYGTVHGRDQLSTASLACSKDGKIQALRIITRSNLGAYATGPGAAIPPVVGPKILTSLYHVPCFHLDVRSYLTNTVPMGAYRGAGRPEAIYLMERLVQKTAEEMGIDSLEFRKRNFIPPDAMPYTSPIGEIYDSGDFEKVLDKALELSEWNDFESRKENSQNKGRIRGRGISCYIEWTGAIWFEEVTTEARADGRVVLYTGTQNMGQGLKTAFTQLLSQQLELPVGKIEIVQGDTDLVKGKGSVGSRSLYIGGSAIKEGAEKFLEENRKLAAEALEAAQEDLVYKAGTFTVSGTKIGIGLGEIAKNQPQQKVSVYSKTTLTSRSSTGCPSWPNGCQVAEVEIDPETGQVYLDALTAYDDVGNAINPMMVEGQVHGGIVQSLGQAFMEEAVFDKDGHFANPSYMDYAMPRADDVPNFKWDFYSGAPCQTNPLGAKGVGELGTVGATPAIVNAVLDALRGNGVSHIDMPLSPQKVWAAFQN